MKSFLQFLSESAAQQAARLGLELSDVIEASTYRSQGFLDQLSDNPTTPPRREKFCGQGFGCKIHSF